MSVFIINTQPLDGPLSGITRLSQYQKEQLPPQSGTVFRHTHPFNGPLSGTTRVSRYQKGKTNLDFTEARDRVAVASAGPCASLHLAPDR